MSSLREIKNEPYEKNRKKGLRFLQTQPTPLFCRICPNISQIPFFSKGDISCHLFSTRGSMTIEAAIVVPLFLFAAVVLLSIVDVMRISLDNEAKLHKLAREAVVYGYLADKAITGREGDYINLSLTYPVALPVKAFGLESVVVRNHSYGHIFNGYDDKAGDRVGETREYVYITESGSVYHKKRSCSHLNISVMEISGKVVAGERNKDGSIYYACGDCVKDAGTSLQNRTKVYVTDYGVRYHLLINCSELKRTIEVVPLSETRGKTPCKDCGG